MKKHGNRIELEDDDVVCPMCYAPQTEHDSLMGILGTLAHHRCRYCGAQFTVENTHHDDQS